MDQKIKNAIESAVKNESLARTFNIELVELDTGTSTVEMIYDPGMMSNIYDRAHGGALGAESRNRAQPTDQDHVERDVEHRHQDAQA